MQELKQEECSSISGSGIHIPKIGNLITNVLFGAIGGALAGITGGPVGMVAAAVAGAALAGAATATNDAFEIRDSLRNE